MGDQKKPETVADEDLDTAQGGWGSWSESTTSLKGQQKKGDGFITYGAETGALKQPTSRMEVVNEDE